MKLLTIILGLVLGGTATALWSYLAKWFADNAFWSSCQETVKNLIEDPGGDDFLKHYVQLLRALGVYLGKTTCRVGITVLPILVALHFFSPIISKHQAQQATSLIVYPQQDINLSDPTATLVATGSEHASPRADHAAQVTVSTPTWTTEFGYEDAIVATNSNLTAVLYQLCGFRVTHHVDAPKLLLIRPRAQDINPLWPFLNDFEFVFWTSMVLASAAMGMLIHKWPSTARSSALFLPHQPSGS